MIYNEIKKRVESKGKGQFTNVVWEKRLKTKANITDIVEKHSEVIGRFGISYDNIGRVKEKREKGILPTESKLPWGKYVDENRNFIEHNGQTYLSVKTVPHNYVRTTYYINGVEATKEEAQKLCLKSEFSSSADRLDVFTLKTSNILSIK